MQEYKHLSNASSLCGNCTEVCPMRINIHEILLENRHEAVETGLGSISERLAWKVWRMASMHRLIMNSGNGQIKNWMVNRTFTAWTAQRSELNFSQKTFNELWKERTDKKG